MGKVNTTLFRKIEDTDLLIIQIYVDDIIFGSTNDSLSTEFSEIMRQEFEMRMMGELNHFLGIQIKVESEGAFIFHSKYTNELLKTFGFESAKAYSTPMSTSIKLDKDKSDRKVDENYIKA